MCPRRRALPSQPWNSAGPRASISTTSGAPISPRTSPVVTRRRGSSRGVNRAGAGTVSPTPSGAPLVTQAAYPPSRILAVSKPYAYRLHQARAAWYESVSSYSTAVVPSAIPAAVIAPAIRSGDARTSTSLLSAGSTTDDCQSSRTAPGTWLAAYRVAAVPSGRHRTSTTRTSGRPMFSASHSAVAIRSGRANSAKRPSGAPGGHDPGFGLPPSISYGRGQPVHAGSREGGRDPAPAPGDVGRDLPERGDLRADAGRDPEGHGRPGRVGARRRPRQGRPVPRVHRAHGRGTRRGRGGPRRGPRRHRPDALGH